MILLNQNTESTVIIIKAKCLFYFPIQKNHCETQGSQLPKDSLKREIQIFI